MAWLNGEYVREAYEKYRAELYQWLASNRPNAATLFFQRTGYWLRFLFYSLFIWPFRVIAVNLVIVVVHLEISHYFLTH